MQQPKAPLNRRVVLAGAGTAGALAAAAAVLPLAQQEAPAGAQASAAGASPASGYRLTEHIQRYYASARI